MKIVFMGTPEFAVPTLKSLIEEHTVLAVFTQPDRPKGRGNKIYMSPVKEVAMAEGIPVYQPIRIKSDPAMLEELKNLKPDFIIVVAFGQILSKEILDIPIYGCINLHASLLPQFRGAAPINWAIIRGEKVSGNTTMLMDVGIDTGDILLSEKIPIGSDMNFGELHDALMESGPALILKTLKGYLDKTIIPIKQHDEISIYASTLNKDNTKIDWTSSAEDIHNLVRGLSPYPTSYTLYEGKLMKVFSSSISKEKSKNIPGEIISVSKDGIVVSAKDYCINITKIQFPGGRPLEVSEYIKGHKIEAGKVLG